MQPAGAGLDKVVARSLRKAPADQVPLLAWPLACGSAVAARTRALEFADGVLRVEVPDAGWRKELQALASRYVAALNRYGTESVTRIEFVVAGRKQASSAIPNKPSRNKRA
jgi:hypothetical protein